MTEEIQAAQRAAYAILGMYDELIQKARPQDDSDRVTYGCWLLLTIFEQFHSALCLIDNGLASHAAGPVRSMLEGMTDLLNLARCETYVDQMKYDSANENVKLFEEFSKSGDLEPEMIAVLAEWNDRDRPVRDKLATSANVTRRLHLEEKLRRVDLVPAYAAYRMFCGLLHPNLTSLNARHRGDDGTAVYRAETPPAMVLTLLRYAIDFATRVINVLPTFSTIPKEQMDAVTDKAVAIWHEVDPLDAADAKAEDPER
jgi:hypothetical protein